ncbi:MAG: hypothetical protein QXX83_04505 [Thermofilum sp.]
MKASAPSSHNLPSAPPISVLAERSAPVLISLHGLRPPGPPCGLRESRKELRARLEEWVERRGAEL